MVNRRKTVLAMMGAVLSRFAVGKRVQPDETAPPLPLPMSAGDVSERAMQEDLTRLGSHEYSDEGIPVFLACEFLGAPGATPPIVPGSELSKRVAADLRRYGDAWERIHPDAPDTDVSKVIEVLAERDFAHSGVASQP